ncbi:MAG: protein translocase subunit SecF [Nitrospiraceae bacterium]|jgi:preprotein translocase subunit SecF|nr:MAG: protein translocase subunit SecF [Nitrospiraceae bacterium]
MFEIVKNTKIDFIGKKYITVLVSGTFILLSIIAIVQISTGKANLGIDFVGGTTIQVRFDKAVSLQNVRSALDQGGQQDVELQDIPAENKVLIKTKKTDADLNTVAEGITTALRQHLSGNDFTVDATTAIGPKVGSRLRRDAAMAIIMAAIGILIYIAFRFHFQFGIGATLATFHDVLAVLAIFYIMGKEINLIVVSALLTIAGYSLTDTVVVYDRIRENLRVRVKEPVKNVINVSLNEVLSRTIITSITTFLAASALFFLGGEVIHDFAFAIMMGIIIGTYSSIFVASPVLLLWKAKRPFAKK